MTDWILRPGETIRRKSLHDAFGGSRQGGISPSASTPNVFLFADADSGPQHGYVDGWQSDGCFHYTGEGQRGDQQMKAGNAALLRQKEAGRAVRVFKGAGGVVTYVDQFAVDEASPFYKTDSPETGGGAIRQVIVFRLRPTTIPAQQPDSGFSVAQLEEVDYVPVENQWTERTYVDPAREPYEAERREATLVLAFRDFLVAAGNHVQRLRVIPKGEVKPIFSDLYVPATGLLVEAKGSVERGCIRMGLGQLLDYRRFVPNADCALLLPEKPRQDLLELVQAAGVVLYIPSATGFVRLEGSLLTQDIATVACDGTSERVDPEEVEFVREHAESTDSASNATGFGSVKR